MALAHVYRQGPQICARHKRTKKLKDRIFQPHQGQFFTDPRRGTRFICFDCLKRDRRSTAKRKTAKRSGPQFTVYHALWREGIKFVPEYKVGKWPFDLGFPWHRLLIEIDDLSTHETKRGKARDSFKDAAAKEEGWTVVRVKNGPFLVSRCKQALDAHIAKIGA